MACRRILVHSSDKLAAAKLVTFPVPSFGMIDDIYLEFTNNGAPATAANIENAISLVTLQLNGGVEVNLSPKDLHSVYKAHGTQVGQFASGTNVISLNAARLLYKAPEAEDVFGIGCDNYGGRALDNIQVQVQCAGTITGVTDVKCFTERRDLGAGKNITRAICRLLTYEINFSSVGESTVESLPKNMNEGYLFIHAIPGGTGKISMGECIKNNDPVFQKTTMEAMNFVVASRGFAPVDDIFQYHFSDGGTQDVLPMTGVTDLRLKTTFSAAPSGYRLIAASVKPM